MAVNEQTSRLTFVEDVAHRTVIHNHHLTQIWLHLSKVFDVRAVPERAVLPVKAASKVLSLQLKPVNDWVRVLLNRSSKNDKVVPLGNFSQKVVTVGPLVHIVQNGDLRSNNLPSSSNGLVQLHLDHVTGGVAAAFGHAVNQSLVEIQDQGLLVRAKLRRRTGCV